MLIVDKVYIVVGGSIYGAIAIDTTEMLVHGGSSWSLAGALPNSGIRGLGSVSLNNEIFVTGDHEN